MDWPTAFAIVGVAWAVAWLFFAYVTPPLLYSFW